MQFPRPPVLLAMLASLVAAAPLAADGDTAGPAYVFAWPFIEGTNMQPRGGTTRGAAVTLAATPDPARDPNAPGLSPFERDRRAILAMAGPYRASFDFLETVGFAPGFRPAAPYRSWGTEIVFVLEDGGEFISLQHILVQQMVDADGQPGEPIVIKHWRQDWRYQDRVLAEHVGNGVWQRHTLEAAEVAGTWSQAVFHVDDSPRYEAIGRWQHNGAFSSWQSAPTRRPLPRREFSVRDDYDLLYGVNRHTILPLGWTHEQDNLKAVLGDGDAFDRERPFLAREIGVNRYERLQHHDFSAAEAYWQATASFWSDVRAAWERRLQRYPRFRLRGTLEGRSLIMTLFGEAQAIQARGNYDGAAGRARIDALLDAHVTPVGPSS